MAILGGIIVFLAALIIGPILNGWVLSILWGWFVVPVFGLPQLSVVPAIGIALVVGYLTHQVRNSHREDDKSLGDIIAATCSATVARPLTAFLFGWIIHLFM